MVYAGILRFMGGVAFAYFRKTGEDVDAERERRIASGAMELGIAIAATQADPPAICLIAEGTNFSRMLVRMHAGEVDTLVIDELSSLSDDVIEQEIVLAHLRTWRINVVCVGDRELSRTDPDRLLLRTFSDRHDFKKRMEALRLQGERVAARKRTGKSEGAKRYGEFAGEKVVMDQIRDLHQKGIGNTEIARRLNSAEMPPAGRQKRLRPNRAARDLGEPECQRSW